MNRNFEGMLNHITKLKQKIKEKEENIKDIKNNGIEITTNNRTTGGIYAQKYEIKELKEEITLNLVKELERKKTIMIGELYNDVINLKDYIEHNFENMII